MSINQEENTSVYCKFSNTAYIFMKRYSKIIGSSVADFIRQAVGEKIMRLGSFKELENEVER